MTMVGNSMSKVTGPTAFAGNSTFSIGNPVSEESNPISLIGGPISKVVSFTSEKGNRLPLSSIVSGSL